jgi:membrane protein implicated in regulation of membrane protease activity
MAHDLPRWRFRLSSLMLWVILLALALTLVLDPWNRSREQERRRLAEELESFVQKLHEVAAAPVGAEVIHNPMWAFWMSLVTLVIAYVAGQITLYLFIRRKEKRTRAKG